MANQPPPPPHWGPRAHSQYRGNSQYVRQDHSTGLCPPPPPPRPTHTYNTNHPYSTQAPIAWSSRGLVPPPPLRPGDSHSHSQPFTQHNYVAYSQHLSPPESKRRRLHDDERRCVVCSVSLDSEVALNAHREAHIKCTHCEYVASKKLVKSHFQSAHGKFSGRGFKTVTVAIPGCPVQRFRICVGNHPDDIKKWILDRKKRFPRQSENMNEVRTNDNNQKDGSTKALSSLLDGYGSSSSVDTDQDDKQETNHATESSAPNSNYEHDVAKGNKKTEKVASADGSTNDTNYRTRRCRYFTRNGMCRNGDACTFSHELSHTLASQPTRSEKRNQRKPNKKIQSNTTLLRKLLEIDARREATLTLQLLRYIVDSNYLQQQEKEAT